VPDRLEGLIGDKRFIDAAVLLVKSIKMSRKPEIADIGAMSELNGYFASQEKASCPGSGANSRR
jgi:exocyst complex component 4